jgi:hypothetical protein
MKEVTITVKLLLEDDQPSCDWIYESIYEQLNHASCDWIYESIYEQLNHDAGEAILEYNDDEPVLNVGLNDEL